MLLFLPRLGLAGILGWSEASDESVGSALRVLDLPIEQADARDQRSDMGAGRLDGSSGKAERRLFQRLAHVGHGEATNAAALEDCGDRGLAQAAGFLRRRRRLPR